MPSARSRPASRSAARSSAPPRAPDPELSLRATHGGQPDAPQTESVQLVPKGRLALGSAARAGSEVVDLPMALDDVVRITYENGYTQWIRADDLLRERGLPPEQGAARGGAPGTASSSAWRIDARPASERLPAGSTGSADRGLLKLGIRLLDVFGVDLAGKTAAWIGKRFEVRQLRLPAGGEPGLYRVDLSRGRLLAREANLATSSGAATNERAKPWLVFLHGTASGFGGSFGKLWQASSGDDAQAQLGIGRSGRSARSGSGSRSKPGSR
jgi:hypothetical protein